MKLEEMREALDREAQRKVAVLQHENHRLKEVIRKKESRIEYLEKCVGKLSKKLNEKRRRQ